MDRVGLVLDAPVAVPDDATEDASFQLGIGSGSNDDALARVLAFQQVVQPLELPVVCSRDEVIPVDQYRDVSGFVVEMARGRGSTGETGLDEELGVVVSSALGCVQRAVHGPVELATHPRLVCLGVLRGQAHIDVSPGLGVPMGTAHVKDQ